MPAAGHERILDYLFDYFIRWEILGVAQQLFGHAREAETRSPVDPGQGLGGLFHLLKVLALEKIRNFGCAVGVGLRL